MAERFVLTAELQLQAPRNVQQVVSQIRSQLSGAATMNVKVNAPTRQIAQASKAMQTMTTGTKNATKATGELSRTLGAAARRFGAITVATGTFLAVARGIKEGVKNAIEYERELIKISQITGKTTRELKGLSKEVRSLATTWGVSSKEILTAARTLTQAGFSADKVSKSLKVLAQTDLGATFDSIADTTEGAVAMLRQFQREAQAAGGDVKFLEKSLGAINAVSKAFAVEASDLISVIRRTGGVFEAAGGKINELIALFTSVRGTTRETAETIATGFRTIFTRIQRTETIDQLKELGIVLQDSSGKFVGPLEAIKKLSIGLSSLDPRDYRFNEIVEQLGGFRQIGKVIPLIKQYSTTTQALSVAQAGSASIAKDAETAQGSLAVQITKVKEKFDKLMASFADSSTFRSIITGALKLAEAFIKVAAALEPVLPMLTAMLSMKIGRALMPGLGALAGRGKNQGGKIYGFNRGGMVPGTGNRDTVPAMMTPGEFVIRKSSVKKLGAEKLAALNGYSDGAEVKAGDTQKRKDINLPKPEFKPRSKNAAGAFIMLDSKGKDYTSAGGEFLLSHPKLVDAILKKKFKGNDLDVARAQSKKAGGLKAKITKGSYPTATIGGLEKSPKIADVIAGSVQDGLGSAAATATKSISSANILDMKPAIDADEKKLSKMVGAIANDKGALGTMEGYVLEGVISALTGAKLAGGSANFDFPAPLKNPDKLKEVFRNDAAIDAMVKADAKRSYNALKKKDGGLVAKLINDLNEEGLGTSAGVRLGKYASGGKVDSIPAMLTPGEYVINARAAKNIGYSKLNRMNSVAKFNSGGVVGLRNGGDPGAAAAAAGQYTASVEKLNTAAFDALSAQADGASQQFKLLVQGLTELGAGLPQIIDSMNMWRFQVDEGVEPLEALRVSLEESDQSFDALDVATLASAQALEDTAKRAKKGTPQERADYGSKEFREAERMRESVAPGMSKAPASTVAGRARAEAAEQAELDAIALKNQQFTAGAQDLASQAGATKGKPLSMQSDPGTLEDYENALIAYTVSLERGNTHEKALDSAKENLSAAMENRANKEAEAAAKATAERDKQIQGQIQGKEARIQKLGADKAATEQSAKQMQAAQSAIFLGSSITAVTTQLGLFSPAMNDAISAALGMASTLVGLAGTFGDIMQSSRAAKIATEMATLADEKEALASQLSTASEAGEASANAANTATEVAETKANVASAASEGMKGSAGVMGKLMGPMIAVAVFAALAQGITSFFKNRAKEATEEADKEYTAIKQGEGSGAKLVAARTRAYDAERSAGTLGMSGAGGAMVAGAAIGSIIPGIGTAIGASVGAIVGFATGWVAQQGIEGADMMREGAIKMYEAEVMAAEGIATLNSDLKAIDLKKLKGFEKVAATSDALDKAMNTAKAQQDKAAAAETEILQGAQKRGKEWKNALSFGLFGKGKGEISEDQQADIDRGKKAGEELVDSVRQAMPQLGSQIDAEMQSMLKGGATMREVMTKLGPQMAKYKEAIILTQTPLVGAAAAAKMAEDYHKGMVSTGTELEKSIAKQNAIAAATEKARLLEKARILEVSYALARLSKATVALDKFGEKINSAAALAEGSFKAVGPKLGREIGDITKVANFNKFNAAIDAAAKSLGPAGKRMADRVKGTAATIAKLRKGLTKARLPGLGEEGAGSESGVRKMLAKAGIDISTMPAEIRKTLVAKLASLSGDISQADLDKIIEDVAGAAQKEADALKKAAEIQDKYVTQYDTAVKALIAVKNKEIESIQQYMDIEERGRDRLAEATGMKRGRRQKEAARLRKAQVGLQGTGARAGDVRGVAARARAAMATMRMAEQMNKAGKATERSTLAGNLAAETYKRTRAELERLADQSAKAADIMSELDEASAARRDRQEALQSQMKDFAFADNKGRQEMNKNFNALQKVLQTGTLASIPDDMRSAVGGLLDKFENVELMPGMTGGDISKQLQIQELDAAIRASGGMGVTPEMMQQMFEGTSTKEQELLAELREVNKQELAAQQELVRLNQENTQAMKGDVAAALKELAAAMRQLGVNPQPRSQGGPIYRAGGGTIFKPRGTDTVPAMLTPGEFVIRKSAVDKVGVGTLHAINSGAAGFASGGMVQYRAGGGPINVMDGDKFGRQYFGKAAIFAKRNPSGFIKAYLNQFEGVDRKKLGQMVGILKNKDVDINSAAQIMGQADWSKGYVTAIQNLLNYINENSFAFAKIGAFSARMVQAAQIDPKAANQSAEARIGQAIIAKTESLWGVGGNKHRLKNKGGAKLSATNELDDIMFPFLDPQILMVWRAAKNAGREAKLDIGDEAREQQIKRMTPAQRAYLKRRNKQLRNLRDLKQQFFAQGGAATDTVPAMLTPGEFVMNAGAVKRNGMGFMKALNSGKIQGFAKGGPVYRQGGGPTENYISNRPVDKTGSIINAINSASDSQIAASNTLISGQNTQIAAQSQTNAHLTTIDQDIKNNRGTVLNLGDYLSTGLKREFGSQNFAKGGVVPGSGNRDSVSAMLTPGEFVVTKSVYKKYGGLINYLANGGPVIPTNFWIGNDKQPESQESLQGLFNYFRPPGQTPLFGANSVKAYRTMMHATQDDFTGRGFWQKVGDSPYDPTEGNYQFKGMAGNTGLYVWDSKPNDGLISAFSLTQYARKQARMQLANGGAYEATVPLFRLLGPYAFADTVDNVRGGLGPAGDASLPKPFVQLWMQFAKSKKIPGFNGLVRTINPASYTFNTGLASEALAFLEKAVTGGLFNPIVHKKAFPMQRMFAGFGDGYPIGFAQGVVARKYPNIPLHHLEALTGKAFGVPSYFAEGGAAGEKSQQAWDAQAAYMNNKAGWYKSVYTKKANELLEYLGNWPLGYIPSYAESHNEHKRNKLQEGEIETPPMMLDFDDSLQIAKYPSAQKTMDAFRAAWASSSTESGTSAPGASIYSAMRAGTLDLDDAAIKTWHDVINKVWFNKDVSDDVKMSSKWFNDYERDWFREAFFEKFNQARKFGHSLYLDDLMKHKAGTNIDVVGGLANNEPLYKASGGMIDSVPAMLTPGEFVMNPQAVKNNGIGFMRALNQGKVKGYRRGGLVGPSYFNEGGRVGGGSLIPALTSLGESFTQLSNMLSQALNNFGSQLSLINFSEIGQISKGLESVGNTFLNVFDKLNTAASVLNNMQMTHNISGELVVRVMGIDSKLIADGIRQGLQQDIIRIVNDEFNRPRGFDATGSGASGLV